MRNGTVRTLDLRTRQDWRDWLQAHHDREEAVWLVFHKRHTGVDTIDYEAAVEEALCFGWIDSLVKRLDDDRYARKFTPRSGDSRWSAINGRRYESLKQRGMLAPPGMARAPTPRSAARPSAPSSTPAHIEERLKADERAWSAFEQLAPSYRRMYVLWIGSAKREDTRERRLREAIRLLAAGKKLGLK